MGLLCILEVNGRVFTYFVSSSLQKGLAPSLLLQNSASLKRDNYAYQTLMGVTIYQYDSFETAALHKTP
jgi:hypothetical protein